MRSPLSSKSIRPKYRVKFVAAQCSDDRLQLQRACLLDRLRPDLDGGVAQQRVTRGLEVLGAEPLDD